MTIGCSSVFVPTMYVGSSALFQMFGISLSKVTGSRGMAVGKRGKPTMRASILKDLENREKSRQLIREQKARNQTDMDRHVLQAYKELELEEQQKKKQLKESAAA